MPFNLRRSDYLLLSIDLGSNQEDAKQEHRLGFNSQAQTLPTCKGKNLREIIGLVMSTNSKERNTPILFLTLSLQPPMKILMRSSRDIRTLCLIMKAGRRGQVKDRGIVLLFSRKYTSFLIIGRILCSWRDKGSTLMQFILLASALACRYKPKRKWSRPLKAQRRQRY